ncbi:hypothetical protein B5M09_012608, partial [Aphanomyces astaci]
VRYAVPTNGPVQWVVGKPTSTISTYCSSMTMHATVDEISSMFTPSSHQPKRSLVPGIMGEANLVTVASPSIDDPRHYIAIRWAAVRSPVPFIKNRDACFTHMDVECDGRKGWVRALKSIDLPECHHLRGLVRMDLLRCGHVVLESPGRPDCVQVHILVHLDMKGLVPAWIEDLWMKRTCQGLRALRKAVVAKRLAATDLVHQHLSLRTCELCARPFTFGTTKAHCRQCSQVMCNECSSTTTSSQEHRQALPVCTTCELATSTKLPPFIALDAPFVGLLHR